jgi:hypothetical protein
VNLKQTIARKTSSSKAFSIIGKILPQDGKPKDSGGTLASVFTYKETVKVTWTSKAISA